MAFATDAELDFDTIEETVEAFKKGSFIIVLDSPSRENEGDLIIAAQALTTDKCAFMIRHTSGYICAPMPAGRAARLGLPAMVTKNQDPNGTPYTISVDANDAAVTTGISAADRALTCRTLAGDDATADRLRRPGHVLPLTARDGGVRERKGHTEAAVEFCRLAGRGDTAVIGELVEDGKEVPGVPEYAGAGMMRKEACLRFARRWGLRCCTIEDLVLYLDRRDGGARVEEKGTTGADGLPTP
ncbi:MAG: hypothetical protein M1838_003850 [Thelocarpon superellum]|nr:MAG: hypothetical protein M1838_003850 [Thelocarpon superellum]